MDRNSDATSGYGTSQKQEPPTFQVPLSISLKARPRQSQQDSRGNNGDKDDTEGEEEEFRILQYPAKPWGRASRSQSTAIAPSRRLISSLIEDAEPGRESLISADTSRTLRNRGGKRPSSKRVSLLLKRSRSPSSASVSNVTESSDDSGSSFRKQKSGTSSIKKPPPKQRRLNDSTRTTAKMHLAPRKSNPPHNRTRARRTVVMPEDESEDEDVEVVAVDDDHSEDEVVVVNDSKNDTSESDYTPEGRAILPQRLREERLTRTRLRSILRTDEEEGRAVESQQEQRQEQEQEPEQQGEETPFELDKVAKVPEAKKQIRFVDRMECVLIPVIDLFGKKSVAKRNRNDVQSAVVRTPARRFARKDNTTEVEKDNDKDYGPRTKRTTLKDATSVSRDMNLATTPSARPNTREDTDATPVVNVEAPRQTRSDARKNLAEKLEPTTTATVKATPPTVSQEIAQERKGNSRQAPKVVETPRKPVAIVEPPHKAIKQVETPHTPLPAEEQAKIFHGWWLKRKESLVQEGNIGIVVQGNLQEPKVMTWHTSTIKDAPEPMLVMTFSGSFYRLSGSIDAQKMEGNGFSKEVIKAFKNGFPADWKSILSKGDGNNAESSISSGKELSNNSENNATTHDANGPRGQESPLIQIIEESSQHARQPPQQVEPALQQVKPVAQQVRQATQQVRQPTQQLKPAVQQERRTVLGSRLEDEAASGIKETPMRTTIVPAEQAVVQAKLVSSSVRPSTLARPTPRTPVQGEPTAFAIPAAPPGSSLLMPGVPKETKAANNDKPGPMPESTLTNGPILLKKTATTKESAPTKEGLPVRVATPTTPKPPISEALIAQASIQRDSTPHQLSTSRRMSTSSGTSLQSEDSVLRQAAVPDRSLAIGEPWKFTGQRAAAVDKSLDGNLRMRSMAVVEQIREHTRQHVDPIAGLGAASDGAVDGPLVVAASRLQGLEESSSTFAKSLSSISSSSQSTFDDID